MNTYLVADGGGTKTECLWFSREGEVLGYASAGSSNASFIAPDKAAKHVQECINTCLNAQPQLPPPDLALLFIPGFAPALPFLKKALPFLPIQLLDDFWNAFYGALGVPEGIVALAGTGSFVAGRASSHSPLVTAGGWGPLFGDEGSGYHLGVLCLKAVSRRFDQGKPEDLLTGMLLRHMGISSVIQLQSAAYQPDFTREQVAKLSYLVTEAANQGDATALALFDPLACALVEAVADLARRIGGEALPVSVTGGMTNIQWFAPAFQRALFQRLPGYAYAPAKYTPLVGGALYLLAEEMGMEIENGEIATRLAGQLGKAREAFARKR